VSKLIKNRTGIEFDVQSMFGNTPYFEFSNDTLHIYVERKNLKTEKL
jgi:hypothetical protein